MRFNRKVLALTGTALLMGGQLPAYAANVGYYDMDLGEGNANQVEPITTAGHTAVNITDPTTAQLAAVDVLFVQNPDNGAFGAEYVSRLADIQAFVSAGGGLIIHDRYVEDAESILPDSEGFDIIRGFGNGTQIDVLNDTTLVTNGPGGVIDDTSLDGGNSSNHGFAVTGSLPLDAARILSTSDPDQIVTFSYGHGAGCVVYSSIPLDFYLGGDNPFDAIYAPNVVAYGAAGCAEPIPAITCPEYQDGGYGGDGDFVALDAPAQRCNWVPQAKINIKEGSGIGFEWRGSLSEEVLGTPTEDTSHVMCIYRDGMLVSQHQVAPGAGWKEGNAETRFNGKYGDSDGVEDMIFQASLDDAKGEVETDDSVLPELPAMPSYSFSVQLMNDAGLCLTADFPLPLDRDSGGRLVSEYSYSYDEE